MSLITDKPRIPALGLRDEPLNYNPLTAEEARLVAVIRSLITAGSEGHFAPTMRSVSEAEHEGYAAAKSAGARIREARDEAERLGRFYRDNVQATAKELRELREFKRTTIAAMNGLSPCIRRDEQARCDE